MSKIVKKKDLDVLIESTLKKAGIDTKEVVVESRKVKTEPKVIKEDKFEDKFLINEELMRFNKLTNYTYKK